MTDRDLAESRRYMFKRRATRVLAITGAGMFAAGTLMFPVVANATLNRDTPSTTGGSICTLKYPTLLLETG